MFSAEIAGCETAGLSSLLHEPGSELIVARDALLPQEAGNNFNHYTQRFRTPSCSRDAVSVREHKTYTFGSTPYCVENRCKQLTSNRQEYAIQLWDHHVPGVRQGTQQLAPWLGFDLQIKQRPRPRAECPVAAVASTTTLQFMNYTYHHC